MIMFCFSLIVFIFCFYLWLNEPYPTYPPQTPKMCKTRVYPPQTPYSKKTLFYPWVHIAPRGSYFQQIPKNKILILIHKIILYHTIIYIYIRGGV
jgi:hypothetical protein